MARIEASCLLKMAIHHTDTEEQHSPRLANTALHHIHHLQPVRNAQSRKPDGCHADERGNVPPFQATCVAIYEAEKHQKEYARDKQCPEKPECTGKKLIVACHGGEYVYHALQGLGHSVGVCHATLPVAVGFIEYSHLKHHIVNKQEKEAPFHEGHIKPLESLAAIVPRLLHIPAAEEVSGGDEEQRHVENIDKTHERARALGVSCHHEDNSNSLRYRY